jgi:hypothetical protein
VLRRRFVLTCAACALAGAVAAAIGDSRSRAASRGHGRVAEARAPRVLPTTASNRQAAVHDAQTLLLGVQPPDGAAVQSSGSDIGPHAPLLSAELASAVDFKTWTVPEDASSVLSFVEAHLPPGSKVVSTGSSGPDPNSRSVIRSWPPVDGVLGGRWLEVDVTSHTSGGTLLHAESQSQWIVVRPLGERIPAGVREVDVTSGWAGKPPLLSRRVTNRANVRRLVALFDSLAILQPVAINCPAFPNGPPNVVIAFRGATGRLLARASVNSAASFSWPADTPGWACFAISFDVLGRDRRPLVGNVITPIDRLLHVRLAARH